MRAGLFVFACSLLKRNCVRLRVFCCVMTWFVRFVSCVVFVCVCFV